MMNTNNSISTLRSLGGATATNALKWASTPDSKDASTPNPTDAFVAGQQTQSSSAPAPAAPAAPVVATIAPHSVGNEAAKKAAANASFDIKGMQQLLDGPHAAAKEKIRHIFDSPMFTHVQGLRKEDYREQVLSWCKELARNGMGSLAFPKSVGGSADMGGNIAAFETMAHFDLSLAIKFGVQMGLWGGSVYNLGTDKHHQKFLPGIMSLDTPGCFAMTETGHGSNVAGLETVAKYDKATDSFIINSTTPGARKDYIGGAAKHAKFATVFTQLEVNGQNEGVHAIIVPIRDEKGNSMPGVGIDDCGEKKGLNGVDNGRLFFTNVSVPRDNLLDKYGGVNEQGEYHSPIENKNKRFFTQIGTLITGRVSIGASANSTAKNGLTTAIRYAEQRKQFGEPETSLLDYQAHQLRLLPRLAKTYALDFAIKDLIESYVHVTDDTRRQVGDVAGGLKAASSWHAIDTLQECREACGAQGYLYENRFAQMQADVDIFSTFEGDNTILTQMIAKGGLDELSKQAKEKGPVGMAIKVATDAIGHAWEKNPVQKRRTAPEHLKGAEFQADAFEYREEVALMEAAQKMRSLIKKGMDKGEAVNQCQKELLIAGKARIDRGILSSFQKHVAECKDESLKQVLDRLCDLYALSTIEENKGWYLEHGYLSGSKSAAVSDQVTALAAELRPDAVALVDSFGIPDKCLAAPIAFGKNPA
ncbi:acyl-CoA dehydrogenase family protein [bacterium]|nr:acyl-CoA dehydrogenase family protein [bacterium]